MRLTGNVLAFAKEEPVPHQPSGRYHYKTWIGCTDELQRKAPVLLRVFSKIVSSNDHRNQQKCGDRHLPGICTAIAVLLKERNREMNGIQRMVSLVLFTSRVQKQVS